MLKIRTFFLALACAPLISLSLHLTNQVQAGSPSKGQAGSGSGANSSNIIVTKELDGSIKITLLPDAVKRLNDIAARLRASGRDSRFTRVKAILLQRYFVLNGIHPPLAKAFTSVLPNIFLTSSDASTTPNLPSVQLPQGKLIASIKALKAGLTIAEANEAPTVNVDKLNEAINIHNKIVLESDPATFQQLVRNSDFVEIGKALTELRAAIQ
ncbi:hypothetical protein [Anabaena sp. PCC 7938]|uniref:hypothetical protein n=1 Tax=Anabaena sp. PCC 7938 TaxID=1296340 RepID=UPI001DC42CF5|nr:hypothetical protein [Anabaena sp. CCAP 1446/1C]MBY5284134.1 hypothetical protein [Anabaena sp. CCAP 1446/1C]MBY5308082.1 hypothetical protein [Anabaena sp. CCAP 1446/1C]